MQKIGSPTAFLALIQVTTAASSWIPWHKRRAWLLCRSHAPAPCSAKAYSMRSASRSASMGDTCEEAFGAWANCRRSVAFIDTYGRGLNSMKDVFSTQHGVSTLRAPFTVILFGL